MNENGIIEKIYRSLDGELDESEQADLDRYLSEHPEAALLADQCREVKNQLEKEQINAPEPNLAHEIMSRIDKEKYATQAVQVKIVRNFWHQPGFRFAFTFAAGIFVGIFLFSLIKTDFRSTPGDTGLMKGTFFDSASPAEWTAGEILNFHGWQVKAACRNRYTGSVVELYLDLSSGDKTETTIEFTSVDFELMAVVQQQVDPNTTISTSADQIRIQSSGDNKIGIKLTNKNSLQHEIAFKITQRDNQLYQNTIKINQQ